MPKQRQRPSSKKNAPRERTFSQTEFSTKLLVANGSLMFAALWNTLNTEHSSSWVLAAVVAFILGFLSECLAICCELPATETFRETATFIRKALKSRKKGSTIVTFIKKHKDSEALRVLYKLTSKDIEEAIIASIALSFFSGAFLILGTSLLLAAAIAKFFGFWAVVLPIVVLVAIWLIVRWYKGLFKLKKINNG